MSMACLDAFAQYIGLLSMSTPRIRSVMHVHARHGGGYATIHLGDHAVLNSRDPCYRVIGAGERLISSPTCYTAIARGAGLRESPFTEQLARTYLRDRQRERCDARSCRSGPYYIRYQFWDPEGSIRRRWPVPQRLP